MKIKKLLAIIACFITLTACDTLSSALQFVNCEYALNGIWQPSLAGVNISNVSNINSFGAMDLIKLSSAFVAKRFPLSAIIKIRATNPGATAAAIQKLQWAIDLEGKEMLNGIVNDAINVPANGGSTIIPLALNVDLFQLFRNDTKDNLINFALNLANAGSESSKIGIRVKPTVMIAGREIPGTFINITKSISSR